MCGQTHERRRKTNKHTGAKEHIVAGPCSLHPPFGSDSLILAGIQFTWDWETQSLPVMRLIKDMRKASIFALVKNNMLICVAYHGCLNSLVLSYKDKVLFTIYDCDY